MNNNFSVADEIIKLKKLMDEGIITEEEFNLQKTKLLSNPISNVSEQSRSNNSMSNSGNIIAVAQSEPLFKIVLKNCFSDNKYAAASIIKEITGMSIADAEKATQFLPHTIKNNISRSECYKIQSRFDSIGCITKILPADVEQAKIYRVPDAREDEAIESILQPKPPNNTPICPKCHSTAITTGARGINWTWGLIGASKTVNRCGNCGYTWTPKK